MTRDVAENDDEGLDFKENLGPIVNAGKGEPRWVFDVVGGDPDSIMTVLEEHTDVSEVNVLDANEAANQELTDNS